MAAGTNEGDFVTALEMVDGRYYEQGSDEYYLALQDSSTPKVDMAFIIARELQKNDYWRVPAIIIRAMSPK